MAVITEHEYQGHTICLNPALFSKSGETVATVYFPDGEEAYSVNARGTEDAIFNFLESEIDMMIFPVRAESEAVR